MRAFPRRGRWRRWAAIVLAAGLLWRVVRWAVVFPMWGDEAFVAVNFLLRDFGTIAGRLEHDMVAPAGFLWSELVVAKVVGAGEASLRFLPFLAGALALVLFARTAFARLSRTAALAALAVLAASYYPVRHAAEVKPYAFDLLAAAVLVPLAWRVLDDDRRIRSWVAFALAGALAVWCSHPAAFVASGALLVLGARALLRPARGEGAEGRGRAVSAAVLSALVVGASFLAHWLLVARHQQWAAEVVETSGQWKDHVPPGEPWRWPLWLLSELTGNLFAYPNGGRTFGSAATTALVALGAVSFARRRKGAAATLLLSPLLPMLVAAALRKYPFGGSARHALHLAVPICLLAGTGIAALAARILGPRRGVRAVRALCGVLALVAVVAAAFDVARPWKKESDRATRDAVLRLDAASPKDERWFVFGSFDGRRGVPDLRAWGGSAAIVRWHVLSRRGESAVFGAGEEEIGRAGPGRVWAIVYTDDEVSLPEEAADAWRDAFTARGGAPDLDRTEALGPGAGSLRATRFTLP